MNRKIFRLILLALLSIVALVLMLKQSNHASYKKDLRDFAIEDTSTVDKIFLVNKANKQILLERKTNHWTVNEKFIARKDLVDLLLKTIHRIKVKEPVANAAVETIIKNLAVKSTKVEIYQKGKLVKTIYVGGPTEDSHGTYMLIEGSKRPFVVEIPGFRGYLSTRFTTALNEWKSQIVFNENIRDIVEVNFTNHQEPDQSYKLTHNNNTFKLYDVSKNREITRFDSLETKKLLFQFQKKPFSQFAQDIPQEYKDSVIASTPMYVVNIKLNDGSSKEIKAFSKPGWGYRDFEGNPMKVDPDHFFLLLENGDIVYAQYYNFDPLFKGLKDFINKK